MKLVNVEHLYISYLQQNKNFHNVMDSKFNSSHNGGRKYIGVCFETENFSYFIPIHKGSREMSKQGKTYTDEHGLIKIKRSKFDVEFIENDIAGNERLTSILKTAYMIPIPKTEIISYDVNLETDNKIKADFIDLINWFSKPKNKEIIKNRCKALYKLKEKAILGKLEPNSQDLKNTTYWLNWKDVEQACAEWTNNKLIDKINNKEKINKYEFYNLKDNNKLYTVNSEVNDGYFIATKTDPTNNQTNYILMKCENNELKNIKDITEFNNKDISNLKEFLKEENKGKFSVIDVVDNMMESQIKPNNKFEIEFTPRPNHTSKSYINKNKN